MTRIASVADSGPVTSVSVSKFSIAHLPGNPRTALTCLQTANGLVFTLGIVALGHDRGNARDALTRCLQIEA